jgi:hypothetical protein
MNIYDCDSIEKQIEFSAMTSDGEISEDLLKQLVETQTKSIEQIDKLLRYVRHLQLFSENCRQEKTRISELQNRADRRIDSIKKYLTPYVESRGKVDAGVFSLSTRKSESIELDDNFNDPEYSTQIISWNPDKKKIKEAIKSGKVIQGARLMQNINLQIK